VPHRPAFVPPVGRWRCSASAPSSDLHRSRRLPQQPRLRLQRLQRLERLERLHPLRPATGPQRLPLQRDRRPHQHLHQHLRQQRTKRAREPLDWSDRDGANKAPDGLTNLRVIRRGVAGLGHHQGLTQGVAAARGLDGLVIHHIALTRLDEQHRLPHL
jgi:hypothetical protein